MSFVPAKGLVLCFRPRLLAHVICNLTLKTTNFESFTLAFFYDVFKEKIDVATAIMLYMDDTIGEEEVLMVFDDELNFVNLVLGKTTFPQNFAVDERPTTNFPPVLPVTDNYARGLRPSKQTSLRSRSQN